METSCQRKTKPTRPCRLAGAFGAGFPRSSLFPQGLRAVSGAPLPCVASGRGDIPSCRQTRAWPRPLFTAPPHPAWSGAALISREGKLVGVGSLLVGNAGGGNNKAPGNMFVPIDRLSSILADLIAAGRTPGPAPPWLGVNTDEMGGRLLVSRITPASPAERAGIKRGDVIVGVNGEQAKNLADFYRKVWAQGSAGATVALDVL